MTLAAMRVAADVPNVGRIVQKDYYGWFQRVGRATYAITPEGLRGWSASCGSRPGRRSYRSRASSTNLAARHRPISRRTAGEDGAQDR